MNTELRRLIQKYDATLPANHLRNLRFGHACVERVCHQLEEDEALLAWCSFSDYLDNKLDEGQFQQAAQQILGVANRHKGSKSIDGSQHAAVSATYALANAMNGKAVEAAEYAAYSKIYGYGAYAVKDPESFAEEYAWQVTSFIKCMV